MQVDHADAQKLLWGAGGLSVLLQVLTGTWGECSAELYRSPFALRDSQVIVTESALYSAPSRYSTTGRESYMVSAAACLRHLLAGVRESHEALVRCGGLQVVLWLLLQASSPQNNVALQEQALGVCLNLSSGSAIIRKALLEAGLVAHLARVLSTMRRASTERTPFSTSLPWHAARTALGCLSNLLSTNRHAKQAFLSCECDVPPAALLLDLLLDLKLDHTSLQPCGHAGEGADSIPEADADMASVRSAISIRQVAEEERLFNNLCCIRALCNLAQGWASLVERGALETLVNTGILEVGMPSCSYSSRLQLEVLDIIMSLLAPSWETAPCRSRGPGREEGNADHLPGSADGGQQDRVQMLARLKSKAVADEVVFDACVQLCNASKSETILSRCRELLKLLMSHSCSQEDQGTGAKMQRKLSWCCGRLGVPLDKDEAVQGGSRTPEGIIDAMVSRLSRRIEEQHQSNGPQQHLRSKDDSNCQDDTMLQQQGVSPSTLQQAATLASQRGPRGLSSKAKSSPGSSSSPGKARTSKSAGPCAAWVCAPGSGGGPGRRGLLAPLLVSSGDDWGRRLSFGAVQDVLVEQVRLRQEAELEAQEAGILHLAEP